MSIVRHCIHFCQEEMIPNLGMRKTQIMELRPWESWIKQRLADAKPCALVPHSSFFLLLYLAPWLVYAMASIPRMKMFIIYENIFLDLKVYFLVSDFKRNSNIFVGPKILQVLGTEPPVPNGQVTLNSDLLPFQPIMLSSMQHCLPESRREPSQLPITD